MKKSFIIMMLGRFLLPGHMAYAQLTVHIREENCGHLVTHAPSADVSYSPGVDVNGAAMAPADLNSTPQIRVPDVISIPVTFDLATNLGIATPFLARPTVGEVQVTVDGRVSFNGQPITSEAAHKLAQQCQRAGVR